VETGAAVWLLGAGTGLSSELFLRHGNRVWAVEPNAEMRAAAVDFCAQYPKLEVVAGTAESTTLPAACADFVAAATAFHWFDADACRPEFRRILKPHGPVVLMWNKRHSEASPFMQAEAPARPVTRPSRSVATMPTDNYMGGSSLHWRSSPLGRTVIAHQRVDSPGSECLPAICLSWQACRVLTLKAPR
jgi:SAM-dependent methyltransferase